MAVAGEMQVTTVRVVGALAVMRFVRTHAVHKIIFTLKVFNRTTEVLPTGDVGRASLSVCWCSIVRL